MSLTRPVTPTSAAKWSACFLVVDGVLLLVDAVDGPMPQTRFVLEKALQAGHKAVVVVNKIDRPDARPDWVVNETFDLFAALGATDEQLDFPVVYANALEGKATVDLENSPATDLHPLFDTILSHIPEPRTTGGRTTRRKPLFPPLTATRIWAVWESAKCFREPLKPAKT